MWPGVFLAFFSWRSAWAADAVTVGQRVNALEDTGTYASATILSEVQVTLFQVHWDDGSAPLWVTDGEVQIDGEPLPTHQHAPGTTVTAKWLDGNFYPATLGQKQVRHMLEVAWDSGAPASWVDAENTRPTATTSPVIKLDPAEPPKSATSGHHSDQRFWISHVPWSSRRDR